MKRLPFTLVLFLSMAVSGSLFSQILIVTDDPAYTTGNASSVLDVKSASKGMLIPRMVQSAREAISSPAEGLLVYQTDGIKGFTTIPAQHWDGLSLRRGQAASG